MFRFAGSLCGRAGLLVLLLATALTLSAPSALAAHRTGLNEAQPGRFELAFVLWDPLAQTSYTLDLGLADDSFFAQGQSDAGYQRFWTLSGATDANLARFRAAITTPAQVRWGVLGFDDSGFGLDAADTRMFTTLEQGTANGVRNGNYTKLTGLTNGVFINGVDATATSWLQTINSYTQDPLNTSAYRPGLTTEQNYLVNGSSFAIQGQPFYFAAQGLQTFYECGCNLTNTVGKSSWFYYLADSGGDETNKVLVDEFDNLSADGYWGLAIDPATGNYVLSYTLTPSLIQSFATTADGKARAALTEYRSGNVAVSIAAPAGEFAGYAPPSFGAVSPVPEPPAGLLLLAILISGIAWHRWTSWRLHGSAHGRVDFAA